MCAFVMYINLRRQISVNNQACIVFVLFQIHVVNERDIMRSQCTSEILNFIIYIN